MPWADPQQAVITRRGRETPSGRWASRGLGGLHDGAPMQSPIPLNSNARGSRAHSQGGHLVWRQPKVLSARGLCRCADGRGGSVPAQHPLLSGALQRTAGQHACMRLCPQSSPSLRNCALPDVCKLRSITTGHLFAHRVAGLQVPTPLGQQSVHRVAGRIHYHLISPADQLTGAFRAAATAAAAAAAASHDGRLGDRAPRPPCSR